MVRQKFLLLFALPVTLLWLAHIFVLSPRFSSRAIEQAASNASLAASALGAKVQESRYNLSSLCLKATASPQLIALTESTGSRSKVDLPNAENFAAVRSIVFKIAPENIRGTLVVGLWSETGIYYSRGMEPPQRSPNELDLAAIVEGGISGTSKLAFGVGYQFFPLPMMGPERVIIGSPLLTADATETLAKSSELALVGLVYGGRMVASGGSDKGAATLILGKMKSAQKGPVAAPSSPSPLYWGGPTDDGNVPQWVAMRTAVTGTPYEVIAASSIAPFVSSLATYQNFALTFLLFLIVWSGVVAFILEPRRAIESLGEEAHTVVKRKKPVRVDGDLSPDTNPELLPAVPNEPPVEDFVFPAPVPPPPSPLEAEANPSLPTPPPEQGHEYSGMPESMPWPNSPPPPPPEETSGVTQMMAEPSVQLQEVPPPPPPPSPFDEQEFYNPDATRVAAIPEELLRSLQPAPVPPEEMTMVQSSTEEQHFEDTYRDFLKTRGECGEPTEGVSYEKFAQKLRKNKEQLIQKYNCTTVRFQVYVKEGKAALKATPVKA